MEKTGYSVLVLAAGLSQRMGVEKFALEFDKGVTFLEHIAWQYQQSGCRNIVIVLNAEGRKLLEQFSPQLPDGVEIAENHRPEQGRFSSIKTGLKPLQDEELIFLQNIDNPDINPKLLCAMLDNIGEADYIHPLCQARGGHPVLITQKVAISLLNEHSNDIILKDFLKKFCKKLFQTDDPSVLLNINTLEDYEYWKSKR